MYSLACSYYEAFPYLSSILISPIRFTFIYFDFSVEVEKSVTRVYIYVFVFLYVYDLKVDSMW